MPAGLTLVEALVLLVVLVGLFLGCLLVPALIRSQQLAARMVCGERLAGIGKAMLTYISDYDGKLPQAGSSTSTWGQVVWDAPTRQSAYGLDANGLGGRASVSSSLYLLVKYADASEERFICPADAGERTWSGEPPKGATPKFREYWDFGANPPSHCGYSYHWMPGAAPLTTSGTPAFAIMADRNPWMPSPRRAAKPFPKSASGKCTFQGNSGNVADQLYGNAAVHQEDGQNVVFLDTHVSFEKRPYCGLGDDNIYTRSTIADKGDPLGVPPVFGPAMPPPNPRDSVLVNDPPTWPAAVSAR